MLLQKRTTLEELIVRALALRSGVSAKRLHGLINSLGHNYSLRGIYKELNKLEEEDIVYKVKKGYRLRLTWIINLLAFADAAYDAYTTPDHLTDLIHASKKKNTQRFSNLCKLDLYWIQVMMSLHRLYPEQPMFLWCPYQWFHLVHDSSVRQFFRAVDISGGKRYHIIGSNTYLDRLALKDLPKDGEYSFSESPFKDEVTTYYTAIGSHLITVKLDSLVTHKIAELFSRVKDETDVGEAELARVFESKVQASLTIEENEKKTKKIKRKFAEFFGITLE